MKEIIKTRWVWNEQTQEHEAVEYHTGKYKLDESDKIAIVSEYIQGQVSAAQIIKKHGISISMTQSGDPLENAIAERANGILKSEWLYKMTIPTRENCKVELCRIIDFYNTQRPHMSIGWQTPEQAHNQYGEQQRCWKNYYHQAVVSDTPQLGVYTPDLAGLNEESLAEEVAV